MEGFKGLRASKCRIVGCRIIDGGRGGGGSGTAGATGLLLSRCGESVRTLLAARASARRRVWGVTGG
jgi:hypothetical protein